MYRSQAEVFDLKRSEHLVRLLDIAELRFLKLDDPENELKIFPNYFLIGKPWAII